MCRVITYNRVSDYVMKSKIVFIIGLTILLGCKNNKSEKLLCLKEKVFTSITSFQSIQDSSEHKLLLATPFIFENLNKIEEYFDYKKVAYAERYDSIEIFPLQFIYNSDTLLLADCNQNIHWTFQNRIRVHLANSLMTIEEINANISLTKITSSDSLSKYFSSIWREYFKRHSNVRELISNRDSVEKIVKLMYNNQYSCQCYISIESNCVKTDLEKCLNIILNSYYSALKKEINEHFRMEICKLSDLEIKNLGHELQLWFIINEFEE